MTQSIFDVHEENESKTLKDYEYFSLNKKITYAYSENVNF